MPNTMRNLQRASSDLKMVSMEAEKAWRVWAEEEVKDLAIMVAPDAVEAYAEIIATFNRIAAGMPPGAKILL